MQLEVRNANLEKEMSSRVAVVIVTYNGAKWVDRCFSSLRQSTIPLDTIVIDNGSTDDTLSRIETGYPEVRIVRTGQNLGFGKANNLGMEMAYQENAEFFFLLNQDAWIKPDALEKLVAGHKQYPAYGVLSPIHLNGAGDELEYGFSNFVAPNKCLGLYSDIYFRKIKDVYDAPFVNAAAWMLTRACLEKVGGFSPSFFHYGEDDNYTDRLKYHGVKLGVFPAAVICHDRERARSPQFFKAGETFRRELIQRSSNPNEQVSFAREWIVVSAYLVLALLRWDRDEIGLQSAKLKLLSGIDTKSIAANVKRSKQADGAFLNLQKP